MAVAIAGAAAWQQRAPGLRPAAQTKEVRLNLKLWQPDAVAKDASDRVTDEMITLLRPDRP